jgi:WD40 repeat protein
LVGYVRDLEFQPNGREVAVLRQLRGEKDCIATILEFPSGKLVRNISNVAPDVVAWSPDGSKVAVGHADADNVDVWDSRSWRLERRLSLGFSKKQLKEISDIDFHAIRFDSRGNI